MVVSMNFNQLRVFQAAARHLNFTRAAEELHLTQPGVSKHVKELEEYYGTLLFDRLGKKIVLTQAGEALYEATTAAFNLLATARMRIDDLGALATGRLSIGTTRTVGAYLLPDKLVQFRQRYRGVDIRVETAFSRQIIDRVLDGSLDLGLVGYASPDPRLATRVFLHDRLVLVVSPLHAWAKRKTAVRLAELSQQTLLVSKRGSGTWRIIEALLEKAGVRTDTVMELGTTEGVKQAVVANLGVAILSGHVLSGELASGALKQISIEDGEQTRSLYLIQHKDRYLTRAAQAFVDLLS